VYTIIAIATTYNRINKTLLSISSLYDTFRNNDNFSLKIIIIDDFSTDGTVDAIRDQFVDVDIIQGGGDLYWNQGMIIGLDIAIKENPDYYLIFNDDVVFFQDAFSTLFSTLSKSCDRGATPNLPVIIAGATMDGKGLTSYGGLVRSSIWHPLRFSRATVSNKQVYCDTLNMNCALMTREVVNRCGNLNSAFQHRWGDIDYGLKAVKLDCKILLSSKHVAKCEVNTVRTPFFESRINLKYGILRSFFIFTGFMYEKPSERFVIYRDNAGFLWWLYFSLPYLMFAPRWIYSKYFKNLGS
jgi:GT2 family glycosyltransferase